MATPHSHNNISLRYKSRWGTFLTEGAPNEARFLCAGLTPLASTRGFEPPTPRLGGVCSIQLSYVDIYKKFNSKQCKDF